ncbi:putative reverse transcriptase domain-containing protein [Tanacetum coccineum]|uniref:Reverse transcriptase domain-containing protein n=1 Tax=Tanacetum coccineum TaxID=301880 RepID=A0ABQ5HBY0_9ASTR
MYGSCLRGLAFEVDKLVEAGGRTRGRSGDQSNYRIGDRGGQVGGQGTQVGDQDNDRRGCTYKEFLACNPKEYDGKGGVIVYTHWIEKIESVQDMSGCRDNQKVKYTALLEERMRARYPSVPPVTFTMHLGRLVAHVSTVTAQVILQKDCRVVSRNVNPVNVRNPTVTRGACFECGSPDHYKSACPRLIRAQGPGGNRPNQALANDGVRVVRTM